MVGAEPTLAVLSRSLNRGVVGAAPTPDDLALDGPVPRWFASRTPPPTSSTTTRAAARLRNSSGDDDQALMLRRRTGSPLRSARSLRTGTGAAARLAASS